MRLCILAVTVFFVVSGCYTATIDTGRKPSTIVVQKNWAHGWLFGLVPPSTVQVASKCTNGVAKVETQLSFPNQIANALTGGLYSPMTIRVTCAEKSDLSKIDSETNFSISKDASTEEYQNVFMLAANAAKESGETIFVRMKDEEIRIDF
ncbi:MAG: hypothetical protein F4Y39_16720 [Gemmatimonadetes bacterium]|nr:hypothetical protein [Gemmatimonadota bacterium]MYK52063.1 hypothetical protein [Gemmatimonadota bacterium]